MPIQYKKLFYITKLQFSDSTNFFNRHLIFFCNIFLYLIPGSVFPGQEEGYAIERLLDWTDVDYYAAVGVIKRESEM